MCQPFAGHRGAVAHRVELGVINRRFRREVEDDDGNLGTLHYRQYS